MFLGGLMQLIAYGAQDYCEKCNQELFMEYIDEPGEYYSYCYKAKKIIRSFIMNQRKKDTIREIYIVLECLAT
jgi:hypothetical protein